MTFKRSFMFKKLFLFLTICQVFANESSAVDRNLFQLKTEVINNKQEDESVRNIDVLSMQNLNPYYGTNIAGIIKFAE